MAEFVFLGPNEDIPRTRRSAVVRRSIKNGYKVDTGDKPGHRINAECDLAHLNNVLSIIEDRDLNVIYFVGFSASDITQ